MNGAHLHLLLTHGPVLGLVFGTILLGYAWWRGGEEVRRLALVFTAVAGLLALPAYFTGEDAEDIVETLPGVSKSVIHEHEEAAEGAAIAAVVTAVLALGGFALALRQGATPRWAVAAFAIRRWIRPPRPQARSSTTMTELRQLGRKIVELRC